MKKVLTLLVLPLLLLTSCNSSGIYVTSLITNKWDRHWTSIVRAGKTTIIIPHHDYYFQFNERKPYVKEVSGGDYDKFNVGDTYTFQISDNETEYFFEESIFRLNEISKYTVSTEVS